MSLRSPAVQLSSRAFCSSVAPKINTSLLARRQAAFERDLVASETVKCKEDAFVTVHNLSVERKLNHGLMRRSVDLLEQFYLSSASSTTIPQRADVKALIASTKEGSSKVVSNPDDAAHPGALSDALLALPLHVRVRILLLDTSESWTGADESQGKVRIKKSPSLKHRDPTNMDQWERMRLERGVSKVPATRKVKAHVASLPVGLRLGNALSTDLMQKLSSMVVPHSSPAMSLHADDDMEGAVDPASTVSSTRTSSTTTTALDLKLVEACLLLLHEGETRQFLRGTLRRDLIALVCQAIDQALNTPDMHQELSFRAGRFSRCLAHVHSRFDKDYASFPLIGQTLDKLLAFAVHAPFHQNLANDTSKTTDSFYSLFAPRFRGDRKWSSDNDVLISTADCFLAATTSQDCRPKPNMVKQFATRLMEQDLTKLSVPLLVEIALGSHRAGLNFVSLSDKPASLTTAALAEVFRRMVAASEVQQKTLTPEQQELYKDEVATLRHNTQAIRNALEITAADVACMLRMFTVSVVDVADEAQKHIHTDFKSAPETQKLFILNCIQLLEHVDLKPTVAFDVANSLTLCVERIQSEDLAFHDTVHQFVNNLCDSRIPFAVEEYQMGVIGV